MLPWLIAYPVCSEECKGLCPECGKSTLRKKVSAAAFRLKGGGWYETDFKTGGKKNLAGDTSDSKPDKGAGKTADSSSKADSGNTGKNASKSNAAG